MQSKTSCFNGALLRKNLTRFWPLWAVYAVAWLLAGPVARFVNAFGRYAEPDRIFRAAELTRDLLSTWSSFGLFCAVVAGILFAMALFSYLTVPRAVGLFHSLPVRREGLFLTNYLTGLLVAVAVQVTCAALEALVLLSAGALNGTALLSALACGLGQMLFFYSFAVLCVTLTGQILMAPVLYGVLNALVMGLCSLVQQMAQAFYYGFVCSAPAWAVWLTPVMGLSEKLTVQGTYDEVLERTVDWHLEGLGTVAVYAAAGVLLALAALAVYRRRPSESAGDTVAVRWAKPLFLWGVALCAALSLGQGLYYLVVDPLMGGGEVSFPGMLLCVVGLCLLGYWGAAMLMRKSFRVLRTVWKGALLSALVTAALCLCVRADVLGLEDYVPALEDVESMTVGISGPNDYYYSDLEDPAEIRRFLEIQTAVLAEKDHLRRENVSMGTVSADGAGTADGQDQMLWGRLELVYQQTDGAKVRRSYTLNYREAELDQPGSAMAQLAQAATEPLVQRQQLQIRDLLRFTGGDLSGSRATVALSSRDAQILYDAVLADMEAGNFGRNLFRQERWSEETYTNHLSLYYVTTPDEEGQSRTRSLDLQFSANAAAVIAALEDLGLTEQVPLVTYAQEDQQSESRNWTEAVG